MKENFLKIITYIISVLLTMILINTLLSSCSDEGAEPKTTGIKIKNIDPQSPSSLKYYESAMANDRVTITYDYRVTQSNGVRIWIKPVSNEGGPHTILYSPSPVFTGSGSKTVIISVKSDENETKVDQLRIIIKDPDTDAVISDMVQDVYFSFTK